jgi:hypothetical protein
MSSRGMPKTREIRATLRKQAEARQAKRDNLTVQQKLDLLPPTGANKQRARYMAQLEKAKTPVAAATPVVEDKSTVKEKKAVKEEAKRLKKENKQ